MSYKRAYIEITNVCNLDCSFCPKTSRPPCFMALETFKTTAKDASAVADELYLHLMGEPLLHPDLDSMLAFCREEHIPVKLTTNGVLLSTDSGLLAQASALRQINISLHSFFANAMPISYEQYCTDIFTFAHQLRAKNEDCVIMLRLWNESADEYDNGYARGQARGHADEAASQYEQTAEIIRRIYGVDITKPTDQPNGYRLGHRYWLQTAERFDWPSETAEFYNENGFCYGLRTHFGILSDGTVVPCCLDNDGCLALGNINETPLPVILQSKKAKEIYDGFSANKAISPLCRRCGYRKRFHTKSLS